ncbi:MAG: hypothetical protein QM681_19155, partial [Novosphingobium sp.]
MISSCIAGFLLLPSNINVDLPGLPDLSKQSVVSIGIVLTYLSHRRAGSTLPVPRALIFLMAMLVVSSMMTVLTNSDIIPMPIPLPALTMHDAFGVVFENSLTISIIVIGVRVLHSSEAHRNLLLVMGTAMLLYSLPALLEFKVSPQLHRWVYGIHPAMFGQQVRGGGFRAVVFLSHGLVLAWFLCMGTVALMALRGLPIKIFGFRPQTLSAYLWVILFLQKSLGALLLGSFMMLALLMRPRRQLALAAIIVAVFLTYPLTRGAGLVPVDGFNRTVAGYSSERSGSFGTRITNEDNLLAKANQRPFFGWGGWGRSRVYDPESGRDISITDGTWIIAFGYSGWIGYLAQFGLMCFPILGLLGYRSRLSPETAALALILSFNLVDMIPNSSLTPVTWLVSGSLAGALAAMRAGSSSALPLNVPIAVPATNGAEGFAFHPSELPSMLRRRWRWLIAPALVGGVLAGTGASRQQPVYRSNATLLIEAPQTRRNLISASLAQVADERIAKIREQVVSRENLARLMEQNGLYLQERTAMPRSRLLDIMRRNVGVDLVAADPTRGRGGTIAFNLTFDYHDARLAQAVTEQLVMMFLVEDKRFRTEQATGTAAFFARRSDKMRGELRDLDEKRRGVEARYAGALATDLALSMQSNSAMRAEVSRTDAQTLGVAQQSSLLAARQQELESAPPGIAGLNR